MTKQSTKPTGPGRGVLDLLVGIALLHGAWAAWLWLELVDARRGGDVTCALGGSQCAQIWDSPFAIAVQQWTLLPVAAWGVVWSAVAAFLPLAARRSGPEPGRSASWLATRWVAGLGLLGVAVLAAVMLRSRSVCSDCLISYAGTLAYAAVALVAGPPGERRFARSALGWLAASGAVAYALTLLPALRTPGAPAQAALEALRALEIEPGSSSADQQLARILKELDAEGLQRLSDGLATLRGTPEIPLRPPRALIGSPTARLRVTEFHDLQCHHCADLHEVLGTLRAIVGPEGFALEVRNFPLDASCNPGIPGPSRRPVSCNAARAMICVESQPFAFELAGKIFEAAAELSDARIYELAEPWVSRAVLEPCMRSETTRAYLEDDIDWANQHQIQGTPLLLINGHKLSAWPPLLMVAVLSGGRADHPLLAHLPPPRRG